jgi:hypothetical protein
MQLALPMLCQSLQAVSTFLGYKWPGEMREQFDFHLFDAVHREQDDNGSHFVPVRARFRSDIPAEYAHRAWGIDREAVESEDEEAVERQRTWSRYRLPTTDQIRELQIHRLYALKFVTGRLRSSRETSKAAFDLRVLSRLSYRPTSPIEAIREFVASERHVELSQWRRIRSLDLAQRTMLGETLIGRYEDALQTDDVRTRMREARRKEAQFDLIGKSGREPSETERKDHAYDLSGLKIRLQMPAQENSSIPLAEALLLTRLRDGDPVTMAPAYASHGDQNLEAGRPRQTTARQIMAIYGRATLERVHASGRLDLEIRNQSRKTDGFVWAPKFQPLADGDLVVLDPDPDSWTANRQWGVIEAIRDGRAHAGYAWIAGTSVADPEWTSDAAAAQTQFMTGLLRFGDFEANPSRYEQQKLDFIGLHGDASMILVQGPPGTGKSTTTGWAVWSRIQGAMASGSDYRIAVACKTHGATDVLLKAILAARERLAAIAQQNPDFFDTYFDRRLLSIPVFRFNPKRGEAAPSGCRAFTTKTDLARMNEIRKWQQAVVGATTNGLGKLASPAWKDGDPCWDLLIVDEASQMSVPEFLVASVGLKSEGRIIVVGDHRQMPPIVRQDWEDGDADTLDPYAMYRSVFDVVRFSDRDNVDIKFEESFRIHRDVAEFLRREVYEDDGIDFHSRMRGIHIDSSSDAFANAVIGAPHPLILVTHSENRSQQRNLLEQELIGRVLLALRQGGSDKPAGVVVPHRAQRAELRTTLNRLAETQTHVDSVDTIERFQGAEREVIIYSATESDPAYLSDTGAFLFDPRRLTVAISRAKAKLGVIASEAIFEYFPTDEKGLVESAIWRNLRDKTCTVGLWGGDIDGYRVEVWGNPQLADDRALL